MGTTSDSAGGFLLYGAAGYSGALIARAAVAAGLRPILAGRDRRPLEALAAELALEHRVADLEDEAALDRALDGVAVVLHCAGPFSTTLAPMLDACLRAGAHYLDLAGEIEVVERLAAQSARAQRRGIMAMAGVGLDIVAGDCLARHVAKRVRNAKRLAIGVHGLRLVSRGTAKTIIEAAGSGRARRGGRLTEVPIGSLSREFDFGWGPTNCLNVGWADVASAWYTTGIPTIDVFSEAILPLRVMATSNRLVGPLMATAPMQSWLKAHVDLIPPGPDEHSRQMAAAILVAEVDDGNGHRAASRLRTPEAYTFTAMVAPVIVARVLAGDFEPGFQTPARVYGADLPLSFEGVTREDLA